MKKQSLWSCLKQFSIFILFFLFSCKETNVIQGEPTSDLIAIGHSTEADISDDPPSEDGGIIDLDIRSDLKTSLRILDLDLDSSINCENQNDVLSCLGSKSQIIHYEIKVLNQGPETAHQIQHTSKCPEGTIYVDHLIQNGDYDEVIGLFSKDKLELEDEMILELQCRIISDFPKISLSIDQATSIEEDPVDDGVKSVSIDVLNTDDDSNDDDSNDDDSNDDDSNDDDSNDDETSKNNESFRITTFTACSVLSSIASSLEPNLDKICSNANEVEIIAFVPQRNEGKRIIQGGCQVLDKEIKVRVGDKLTFKPQTFSDSIAFSWNFGDGSEVVNSTSTDHTFSSSGEYNITLSWLCGDIMLAKEATITVE